jgi:hypothetical protein
LAFVERGGNHRVRLAGLELSQSTFNVAAALVIGAGGGYGAVGFRRLIDFINLSAVQEAAGRLSEHLGAASILVPLALGGQLGPRTA